MGDRVVQSCSVTGYNAGAVLYIQINIYIYIYYIYIISLMKQSDKPQSVQDKKIMPEINVTDV